MELRGKVALVTGAGSGLGEASALLLAKSGADVVLISRTRAELDRVAEQARGNGRRAMVVEADVSEDAAVRDAFSSIARVFGRLDILFANAGINGSWAPLEQLTSQEWDETLAVNLRSTFLCLHYAVPLMKQQGGSIIITSSINGTRTFTTAGASAYATSKAGQLALGQMAALELAKYHIRVNVICPGEIDTEIDDNTRQRNTEEARVPAEFPQGTVPLSPGRTEDVAELVLFLASERSRHITGTPIWIDGAQSLLV